MSTGLSMPDDFNWGLLENYNSLKESIYQTEIKEDVYQKLFQVEAGDTVVDIGSGVGLFVRYIVDKKPKQVYCLEPNNSLFDSLVDNVKLFRVLCINKAIGNIDGIEIQSGIFDVTRERIPQNVYTITFKSLCKDLNIRKIDFLKVSCSGNEYSIFSDNNLNWIRKNAKKIVITCSLFSNELRTDFINFKNSFLNRFKNVKVFDSNSRDISNEILYSNELDHDNQFVTVYIDNRILPGRKWHYSTAPTFEFTTIVTKSGCVMNCLFCPQTVFTSAYQGTRILTLDSFKKAIDKIPSEIRIAFSGFMEPWMNRRITDMIMYTHDMGHDISIFTTGVGMSLKDVKTIEPVLFAESRNNRFLLHLPDRDRIAKHPLTDTYLKVLTCIKEISSRIRNFEVMAMGPIHPKVEHLFPNTPIYKMYSRADNLFKELLVRPELFNYSFNKIYHGEIEATCNCPERLYHNIMMPNGDVYLCCMDWSLDYKLGNLFEDEFEDILPEPYTCYKICRYCENGIDINDPRIKQEVDSYKKNITLLGKV